MTDIRTLFRPLRNGSAPALAGLLLLAGAFSSLGASDKAPDLGSELKRQIKDFEEKSNKKLIEVFRNLATEIEGVVSEPPVDPNTRQRIGRSDIDEVIIGHTNEAEYKKLIGGLG